MVVRSFISTSQTSAFVYLVDALTELVPEMSFVFDDQSVQMTCTTSSDAVLVHYKLPAKNFNSYEISTNHTLQVQTAVLLRILKTSTITDQLCIIYDESENLNKMEIRLTNQASTCVRSFHIPANMSPDAVINSNMVFNSPFERIVHVKTRQLANLVSNLVSFADKFTITTYASAVAFSFNNNQSFVQRGRTCIGSFSSITSKANDDNTGAGFGDVRESVTLLSAHMTMLTKCLNLYPVCNLYMATNYPLVVEILVNELGVLKIALAPVDDD